MQKYFLGCKNIFLDAKIFFGLKNFKNLLISLPKCLELNSESKPKLIFLEGLVLV